MDSQTEPNKPKGSYWKFVVAFLAIIFIVFSAVTAWGLYAEWRGSKNVERLAEMLKKAQEDDYRRALADTYGGKTPQETLRMYIDAVEKGDYELASKYFIGDRQEKKLRSFNRPGGIPVDVIRNYLSTLREVLEQGTGKYADNGNYFSFDGPILIRLKKYPNGIWKIIEI